MKLKILFIITQSELGGAQRWVYDIVTNLNKNNYEITVAAGENGPLLQKLNQQKIKTINLRHLNRNINPLEDFLGLIEIYRLIIKERPNILQLCSAKAGFLGSVAGKLAGIKKIIYRIGGWSFNDPRPQWQNLIFFWLEKLTAPLKNKIIVNSRRGYDEALRYKICPREKLVLIYNGIETGIGNQELRIKKRESNESIIVGCIANFYPTKGLRYLIEAGKILKFLIPNSKILIHIVGDGQERPFLQNLIKKYQLDDNVILAGRKENPWEYLQQKNVDMFVIPSVKEGMPYVLLEAMSAGLPIISTDVGGISEIIKNKKNGVLVPSKNPQALAEAIKLVCEDLNLKNIIAQKALEDVKQFDISKMIKEYELLILAR